MSDSSLLKIIIPYLSIQYIHITHTNQNEFIEFLNKEVKK